MVIQRARKTTYSYKELLQKIIIQRAHLRDVATKYSLQDIQAMSSIGQIFKYKSLLFQWLSKYVTIEGDYCLDIYMYVNWLFFPSILSLLQKEGKRKGGK